MLPLWQTVEELPAEKVLPALQREGVPLMKHHGKKKHGHPDRLVVLFFPKALAPELVGTAHLVENIAFLGVKITMQLLITDTTKGLNLTIAEILAATGQVFPSSGPFQVDVTDPTADADGSNSGIVVTPGSPDQTTPTNFKASGNNRTGTITVKVTDVGTGPGAGLVGTGSFDVAGTPPPPPKPDTLKVDFVAAT